MSNIVPQLVVNNQQSIAIPFDISPYVDRVCSHLTIEFSTIEITLFSPADMAQLNQQYFNQGIPTDTISFNLSPEDLITGDIYLCPSVIQENAVDYKHSFEKEFKIVIIHSLLHLINYTDTTPETAAQMAAKQTEVFMQIEFNEKA